MIGDLRPNPVVLAIEPPEPAAPGLARTLDAGGYTVWSATNGMDARKMLAEARREQVQPDAVVLEQRLPDVDGRVLCSYIRPQVDAPIILCGPTSEPAARAIAYHIGIDAFLPSPAHPDELYALLQSLLRRVGTRAPERREPRRLEHSEHEEVRVGSLVIHERKRSVSIDEQPVALTPTQYRLLVSLAKQPNVLVPLDELTQSVWNCDPDDGATSLVATQVARLRAKLREGSTTPPSIVSVPSRGYRLLAA